jgi:hypothetical protein
MADIDVVPKRRSNLWWWIIAAIVVAVIIFVLMGRNPSRTTGRVSELGSAPPLPIPAAAVVLELT